MSPDKLLEKATMCIRYFFGFFFLLLEDYHSKECRALVIVHQHLLFWFWQELRRKIDEKEAAKSCYSCSEIWNREKIVHNIIPLDPQKLSLEADPHFQVDVDEFQRQTPNFWGCMLMNSRGGPPFSQWLFGLKFFSFHY